MLVTLETEKFNLLTCLKKETDRHFNSVADLRKKITRNQFETDLELNGLDMVKILKAEKILKAVGSNFYEVKHTLAFTFEKQSFLKNGKISLNNKEACLYYLGHLDYLISIYEKACKKVEGYFNPNGFGEMRTNP